jgi:hypothetical protein
MRYVKIVAVAGLAALVGCQGKSAPVTEGSSVAPVAGSLVKVPAAPPAPTDDLSSVRATLRTFAAAMERGDVAGVKLVSISDPKSDKLLDAMVPTVGSMKRLNDAAVKRFGEAGKSIASDKAKGMEFAKSVDDANIVIQGDTATATMKDSKEPAKLKRINGEWKLDFVSAMGPETKNQNIEKIAPMFTGMTKAANEGAADIEAGKYKTVEEANQAIGMKLMTAMFGGMADAFKDAAKQGGGAQGNPFGGAPPGAAQPNPFAGSGQPNPFGGTSGK